MWKTRDGGRRWSEISPDLTRKTWDVPENVGKYRGSDEARPEQRGVIYAIAPSPADERTIWAGTDDGLIHVTRDGGKTWRDVTPAGMGPWAKVSIMDASHFDAQTAYAAINTLRLDDLRPHIYRTHDGGKTWFHAVNGLPDGGIVNVVREDPRRKGLLYAGTEQAVYVSFDDGDSWQPLRLNMPATSIRDLAVKDSDLIAATHGRGFWILDDVEPLRQDFVGAPVKLLRLQQAWRVRWNQNTDTPLPPDEPTGKNPPDGAIRSPMSRAGWCGDSPARIAQGPSATRGTSRAGGSGPRRSSPPRRACTGSSGTCTGRRRRRWSPSIPSPPFPTTRRASRAGRGRCPASTP